MGLLDRLRGSDARRLRLAAAELEAAFGAASADQPGDPGLALSGKDLERAARTYGQALRRALSSGAPQASDWFSAYDRRISDDKYAFAFSQSDEGWLGGIATSGSRDIATVVFGVATRLRLDGVRRAARDRIADLLGAERDANLVVSYLQQWLAAGLLDADALARALRGHLLHTPLDRDAHLWTAFFREVPGSLLPDVFQVHCFLGRGSDAIRLADSPASQQRALDCCLRSEQVADVRAGLALARRTADVAMTRALHERAGDLLLGSRQYAEALESYRAADRSDQVSECHEALGQFAEAVAACPADQPDRLARLAQRCQPEVDDLIGRRQFTQAARRIRLLLDHLGRAAEVTDQISARRDDLSHMRAALLAEARGHFAGQAEAAGQTGPAASRDAYRAWSQFEEEAGELASAARLAEDGGELYRASRLFRQAGRFGDADRVLQRDETPEGLTDRARAREEGGDLVGAARLYEKAGQPDRAVSLLIRAGQFEAAAGSLLRWLGDAAIEDPRLADCLRRSGGHDELARICLRASERPAAVSELRLLDRDGAVPAHLEAEVRALLGSPDQQARREFETRAQGWVAQARTEIDRRFAKTWGLDLGTTTSVAAIYDTATGRPVLCPWLGQVQFASTLSVDREGNELVGLAGEQTLAKWLRASISGSKRKMGTGIRYRLQDRFYRPEEVAARLISHARGLVEGFLAGQVRDRVGELARAELGEVSDEWLAWAEQEYDLRLDRPRVLVTIPAYFTNNQKYATRAACVIAGTELARLVHEPTAACLTAVRERHLSGRVVVVDLGAGTLDISLLEVGDGVYEVQQVLGNNNYGSSDFDAAISRALTARLAEQGIQVPNSRSARRRLEIAAEQLKVALSGQEHAEVSLPSFAGRDQVSLELSRADLTDILAEPLATLRETCVKFSESLTEPAQHLVLIGRPMLSPLICGVIEEVFGLRRTMVSDPRTAVASGAALEAAVLDGKLKELLLLDVTPLALGLKVVDDDRPQFSALVEANTFIPVERHQNYTTTADNQTAVHIEIFNGDLEPGSRIGDFLLEDIAPAPKGTPTIQVTFSIDVSCVLEVTALDTATGRSRSVRVTDTTLLSPGEIDAMQQRHQQQRERHEQQQQLQSLRRRLPGLIAEARAGDGEAAWREFRDRKAAHRRPSSPLDAATEQTLFEIFRDEGQLQADLELAQRPLSGLASRAEEYLNRPQGQDLAAELTEGREIESALTAQLDPLRSVLATLARWNTLLVRLAMAEPDPLRAFRSAHDSGNFHRALDAAHKLPAPLEDPADIDRHLHCLAELGDADGYRTVLLANASRLGLLPLDPARPEALLGRLRPALARVQVHRADGSLVTGSGFLVGDRLVATNRHWLAGRRTVQVTTGPDGQVIAVAETVLPTEGHHDLALLRLAEPVAATPPRLGYAKSVRIGDRVWAASAAAGPVPGDDEAYSLSSGIIDQFESFPEENLLLFKVSLPLSPECSGGPLLSDLGEVVGVLTSTSAQVGTGPTAVFALTADSLTPLLNQHKIR
jgi:molecular chaperone DnaK